MADKSNKKGRVNIGTPKKEANELTEDEMKKVKGGHTGGINVVMGDGSVRFLKSTIQDGTSNIADGTSNITDGTSNITDGTSNTLMIGEKIK